MEPPQTADLALSPTSPEVLEQHRQELTGYCLRMLGSRFEAQDAVQETMVRAWQASAAFEGRSSVRTWLFRIATNVCLDMLRGRRRSPRSIAMDEPAPFEGRAVEGPPNCRAGVASSDPAEIAANRDSVHLAFGAVLHHLPPRQRAVLILCEVLRWPAHDAAELLDTTVAAVNSALQRARARLATAPPAPSRRAGDRRHRQLTAGSVVALERHDVRTLVTLLHDDDAARGLIA